MAEAKAAEMVRKITVKGVMGGKVDLEKLIQAPNKRLDLCDVFGIARRFKPDQSDLGAFVRFYGRFRAVNLNTGESVDAPQLIAPNVVQDLLYGAMGDNDKVNEVSFAVRIGVKFDNDAAAKYTYTVTSLMKAQENDPLALMQDTMREEIKKLPKPVTEKDVKEPKDKEKK